MSRVNFLKSIFFIPFVGLFSFPINKSKNKYIEYGKALNKCSAVAQEFNISFIDLAWLIENCFKIEEDGNFIGNWIKIMIIRLNKNEKEFDVPKIILSSKYSTWAKFVMLFNYSFNSDHQNKNLLLLSGVYYFSYTKKLSQIIKERSGR